MGEPGLRKDQIGYLIHFASTASHAGAKLARINSTMLESGAWRLFGVVDADSGEVVREGAFGWASREPGGATLLLNRADELSESAVRMVSRFISTGEYQRVDSRSGAASGAVLTAPSVRLILTTERALNLDGAPKALKIIKVPPLRVRRADIVKEAQYSMRQRIHSSGGRDVRIPSFTPEARRLLEAYEFPGNLNELNAFVAQGLQHATMSGVSGSSGAVPKELGVDDLWSMNWSTRLGRSRLNLLTKVPFVKDFLRSGFWTDGLNWNFTRWAFPLVLAVLFLGPQDRDHNVALNFFWDWWWPLILIAYPFVGRMWCAVCPFMIYGEWAQRVKLAAGGTVAHWPKGFGEKFGGWFLWALFAAILMWEELWNLEGTASLSAWLLVLITSGAVACSLLFERRFWCRYMCPIGGMNGMFAKLAMVELRSDKGVCSAECSTYHCIKGGPKEGDGMETNGCPLFSHPANLEDNRDCTFCGTCIKACPTGNPELRLRIPAADLWWGHRATAAESALLLLLLGAVYVHHLPEIISVYAHSSGGEELLDKDFGFHAAMSAGFLFAPGVVSLSVDTVTRAAVAVTDWVSAALSSGGGSLIPATGVSQPQVALSPQQQRGSAEQSAAARILAAARTASSGDRLSGSGRGEQSADQSADRSAGAGLGPSAADSFVELSYGWMPFVWLASLAHYMDNLGSEAGKVLPVAAETFGMHGAARWLPYLELDPAVIAFLQSAMLLSGVGLSVGLSFRIAYRLKQPLAPFWAQSCLIAAAGVSLAPLIVQSSFLAPPPST